MSDKLQVRIRIDFSNGRSVGPGKIALLEAIDRCGSLSEAARELKLSYRRAWLLQDDLNASFEQPVVSSSTGGAHGGGAVLTPLGRKLIQAYHRLAARTELSAKRLERQLRPAMRQAAPKRLGRQRLARTLGAAARD
jgi:molybdate transport system regulatory protein